MHDRRKFLLTTAALGAGAAFARTAPSPSMRSRPDLTWRDVRDWGIEGKGWTDTAAYFDRLPAKAQGVVRDQVWNLSRQSAGMSVQFETDARAIRVRYRLNADRLAMAHMPATGVSGLDLYGWDENRWRWAAVYKPQSRTNEGDLLSGMDAADSPRRWRIYLPLYNGVESLEIGLDQTASFTPIAPRQAKPIAFYGTSILHGACASRPGMAWPSIVGRRLARPTLNLGFSGNGRMEPEVGALLAELDAAAFVIDCAPNMNPAQIRERAGQLVETVRNARPGAPIVLVEDRMYGYDWIRQGSKNRNTGNRQALREVYESLRSGAVADLHYVESGQLLGDDYAEAMTDGSHPNDMGMTRYADALTPVLQRVLG